MLEEEFVLEQIIQGDYLIAVDRGLEFLHRHHLVPHHIVGDFDSVSPEVIEFYRQDKSITIHEFQPEKDASDTEIGVRLAIELGYQKIDILGATGNRIDHVLANIQVLAILHKAGCCGRIMDSTNCISIVNREEEYSRANMYGQYFSVFSLGNPVTGLTMKGCKYPLENHTLEPYDSLSVSNQMVEDVLKITYKDGILILIEVGEK